MSESSTVLETKLLAIKQEIEQAQQNLNREEGVIQELTNQLRLQGFETVESAEQEVAKISVRIDELNKQIARRIVELEEKLLQYRQKQ